MNNNKIDFVIVWVDGNDPKWLKDKNKYLPDNNQDDRNIRYRNWDTLKYWFRGVEQYTNWVNKIFFVTYGHIPKWLNTNNPKLEIVNHKDYIPKEYLPTFGSHAIELNLHRIKGLSNNFVFFNDDMFIINKLKEKDFFENDRPKDVSVFSPISVHDEIHRSRCTAVINTINKYFNKKELLKNKLFNFINWKYGLLNIRTLYCLPFSLIPGFYESHCCNSYNKDTFKEVWNREYDLLNETCLHKFRTKNDLNQYIMKYWQFCNYRIIPTFNKKKRLDIFSNTDYVCNFIKKRKKPMICINDGISTEKEFNIAKKKIIEAFEEILPDKSTFEK